MDKTRLPKKVYCYRPRGRREGEKLSSQFCVSNRPWWPSPCFKIWRWGNSSVDASNMETDTYFKALCNNRDDVIYNNSVHLVMYSVGC